MIQVLFLTPEPMVNYNTLHYLQTINSVEIYRVVRVSFIEQRKNDLWMTAEEIVWVRLEVKNYKPR